MVPVRTAAALLLVLLSAGVAHGFQLRKSDDGKVLIWDANNVKVKIDTSSPAAPAGAADAVKAGFWAWTSAGVPLKVHFSMASSPLALAVDGVNAVLWQTQEWKYGKSVVAMTVSSYSKSSAFVSESDLVLNARDHSWRVDPQPGAPDYDVQNVVAHEAGHFFGLGHSARPEATMYATTPPAETAKRSLSADDRDGIAALIAEINRRRQLPGGGKGDTSRAQAQPSSPSDTELTARGEAVGCSMAGGAGGSWIWPALLLLLGLVLRRA